MSAFVRGCPHLSGVSLARWRTETIGHTDNTDSTDFRLLCSRRGNTPARALRIAKSWKSCRFSACFARGGLARSNRAQKL